MTSSVSLSWSLKLLSIFEMLTLLVSFLKTWGAFSRYKLHKESLKLNLDNTSSPFHFFFCKKQTRSREELSIFSHHDHKIIYTSMLCFPTTGFCSVAGSTRLYACVCRHVASYRNMLMLLISESISDIVQFESSYTFTHFPCLTLDFMEAGRRVVMEGKTFFGFSVTVPSSFGQKTNALFQVQMLFHGRDVNHLIISERFFCFFPFFSAALFLLWILR